MPRLIIANTASAAPMGAQVYEEQIATRAADALAGLGEGWQVRRAIFRSMRSPLAGTHRLPMAAMNRAPAPVRAAVGRLLYPRKVLVHRMGLELPPAPHEVVTLHDVAAWQFPDESAPVRSAPAELRRAAAVVCVSQNTADQAAEMFGLTNTVVIPNGVDERFLRGATPDPRLSERLDVSGPYILCAGGASRRKNLPALAQAWPLVRSARPDVGLVLSGPPHPVRTQLFGQLPGVRLVGRIPGEDVPALMAGAAAMVVPSLYEGFGLPALEAMAVGTPLVASNRSSLPEVVGDAGLLVEPTAEAIAEGLLRALDRAPEIDAMVERGRQRARQYTWQRCAEEHARVWQRHALA